MPRTKKLRLGWSRKGLTRIEDTGFYPDPVVEEIAGRFGIEGTEALWSLKQRLETAGTMYQSWTHNAAGPLPRDVRAYFQTVLDRSHELLEIIEGADDRSWDYIWRTESRLQQDAFDKGDSKLADVGVLRWSTENNPDNLIAEFSDLSDSKNHLKYIELLATECLSQVRRGEAGRRKNQALYRWIYEMASYWERKMGKNFTVTYHQNQPTSDAGQFLEACLAPMDQEAVEQLVSQMRRVLKDRKNRASKN